MSRSFRPLAGIMVLMLEVWEVGDDGMYTFPSPCGDYGSYLFDENFEEVVKEEGFRPLAGIMVLICPVNLD